MDLILYKNFSVYNKLNKQLTPVLTISAVQSPLPVQDMEIELRYAGDKVLGLDGANYFSFNGGYYFLDQVEYLNNGTMIIRGTIDLLMTYKNYIEKLSVRAIRSTSAGLDMVEDGERTFSVNTEKSVLPFPKPLSQNEEDGCYIMVTSQKGFSL